MAGDIGKGVYALLTSFAVVTDVVGSTNPRVRPSVLLQGEVLPAITFQIVSGDHVHHLTGSSNVASTRVQIDCYDSDQADANSLAESVRKNLIKYSGTIGGETLMDVLALAYHYGYEPPRDGSNEGRYFHSRDYQFWHQEPALT